MKTGLRMAVSLLDNREMFGPPLMNRRVGISVGLWLLFR